MSTLCVEVERNLQKPKIRQENETIKDRIIRYINKVLEHCSIVAANHEEIGKHPQRTSKKCEKNNPTIALDVLLVRKKESISPAYISKQNSYHDKQFILLMIPNIEV